ncbi:aminoglycoside phosphotransferase family protein [Candidatus Dojkabacteria bacterium]|nr:aminoglycoside phosphotransferase family protein [Candidatus Dojkabacteria bacterium]
MSTYRENTPQIDYAEHKEGIALVDSQHFPADFNPDTVNYFNVHRPQELILALQQRVEHFDVGLINPIFEHALNDSVNTYEVSKSMGTGHVIIFVQTEKNGELVLRANALLDQPEMYMELEFDFLKIYKALDIPVNELVFADASRSRYPFDYQIMKRLPGRDLGADWAGSQEDYEKICREQGANIARMHKYKGNGWGRIRKGDEGLVGHYPTHNDFLTASLSHDLDIIGIFNLLTPEDRYRIQEYFISKDVQSLFSSTTSHLLHNDPSDLNMRYLGNTFLCYFDWENAAMFDPINELGTAPTWKSAFPKRKSMVEGYVNELGYRPDNLEEKMNVYFLRKMLDKVAFALKGSRLNNRHIELFKQGLAVNHINIDLTQIDSIGNAI